MPISDFIWIVLLLVFLSPMLGQGMRKRARKRLIRQIETERGSRLILLVHRQESMSLFGIPLIRYIDIDDSEQVLRAIRETDPSQSIDFVLHTPGGLAIAAQQIARALKAWPGEVTVHVPHYAMSGGTLIALAADEICMTEHAMLGPLDPQVGGYPAAALRSVIARKPIADIDDETLILANVAEKAVTQMRENIVALLGEKRTPGEAEKLARLLTEGEWTHDRAITAADLKNLGFSVSLDMHPAILDLMTLYRAPVRGQRTVEYLPRDSA